MRPTAWVNFLAVFLLTVAVTNGVSTAQAMAAHATRPATPPQPAAPPQPSSWVVKGDWMTTDDEAVKDALEKAKARVTAYLREQKPSIEWSPDTTWIQQKLVRDLKDEQKLKELEFENRHEVQFAGHTVQVETKEFKEVGLGEMRRAGLLVEVSPFARGEIEEQDRHYQVKQRQDRALLRQGVLVKVLAGLVALLAAVACYLRLEDATKGYYTTLLRLAAVAFVALVVVGILVLA